MRNRYGMAAAIMAASMVGLGVSARGDDVLDEQPRAKRKPPRIIYRDKLAPASANINRHTGQPHEHKREIARRKRQAERRAAHA